MQRIKLLLIGIVCFSACAKDSAIPSDNEFIRFVENLNHLPVQKITKIEGERVGIYQPLSLTVTNEGNLIIVDHSSWTLHLLNRSGDILATAGGVGRGPGEFRHINQVEIGADGDLYVFDPGLGRISVFSIDSTSLRFKDTMALPNYNQFILRSIHHSSELGMIGVFRERLSRTNPCQPFYVYTLGANLDKNKRLAELPCNDTYQLGSSIVDNNIGRTTLWSFFNDEIYYSRSDEFSFQTAGLHGNGMKVEIDGVPPFLNDDTVLDAILYRMRVMVRGMPNFEEQIRSMKTLTYFLTFNVSDNQVYYTIFNPLDERSGKVLRVDKESGEYVVIDVPYNFVLYAVDENGLYGIQHDEREESNIVFINL